ncbi:cytochrome P450 4c3 [Schistocerca piceifrons]|uniref:cytochrome P450 4c3 n=1 Tax=Schistocerca piceifrons TaxID=274613 RepID=UPI001F5E6B39|nr:cytochrome P450 4c3 [Schistocerca piceifrons]
MAVLGRVWAEAFGWLQSPAAVVLVALAAAAVLYRRRRARLVSLIQRIPGPPALPIIGNAVEINVEHDELFARLTGTTRMWGQKSGVNKAWHGSRPYVQLFQPEVVEPILNSNKHIEKSGDYVYLQPWLGTGLLTSGGSKWHERRKLLTPAFHFRILDDFVDVFAEQSALLVRRLAAEEGGQPFNAFPYVTLCTLDIICETAMGRNVNAQADSESEYVRAVYEIGSIVQSRQAKMWLQPDWIFRLTSLYKKHEKCIEILHGFSNKVIMERKEEIRLQKERQKKPTEYQTSYSVGYGMKKRLAFLDLLIEYSKDGTVLTNEDIREEVDTFMFEGHDTTSAAICWSLYLIGSHPDVQEKVVAELEEIFAGSDRRPTMRDLVSMRYLECCIKEALRLYPSVPLLARQLTEDVQLGSYQVPAGTTALVVTYMLHRDPRCFPQPERFLPERFLPENSTGRHPYAYIPFSAGPRNCIGQKFAILEEKAVISTVLRHYRVEAVDRREDLTLLGELILRPKDGLRLRIERRL